MAKSPKVLDYDAIAAALDLPLDELQSLRASARQDPQRYCPLIFKRGDEEHSIEPGQWLGDGWEDPATGLPPLCPVTPLGLDGENFYFLNTSGQVHVLKAGNSGKGPIDALFAGRGRYLEWAWPRFGKPNAAGERAPINGYHADECRRMLFDACAFKGAFDVEDKVRGRGFWRNDDGGLIYHAGDAVHVDGTWRRCGEIGRFIYPARPRLGRPAKRAPREGEDLPGHRLLELLQTFNWDRAELDPYLALGWAMTAKVGGALRRRPVAMVNGEEGSGKSVFQDLMRDLMNGALVAASDTTQAGIYQRVKEDSVAVMVDENEPDPAKAEKLLKLARIAYSGDKLSRGGENHTSRLFTLMSSCLFTSITKPATQASDDSRMAVLMMRPLDKPLDVNPMVDVDLDAMGRQLLRRWFLWWPRWDELLKVFRVALIAVGHDSRACDTFAPLAAAAHLALWDAMPTPEDLAMWSAWLKADELAETATKTVSWKRCFNMLLNAQPEVYRNAHDKRRCVADYLHAFEKEAVGLNDCFENLPMVGLTIKFKDGDPEDFAHAHLFVPTTQPALNALFRGTDWEGRPSAPGPWSGALRQAPRELWFNDKCGRGLDKKAAGISIKLAAALAV